MPVVANEREKNSEKQEQPQGVGTVRAEINSTKQLVQNTNPDFDVQVLISNICDLIKQDFVFFFSFTVFCFAAADS